MSVKVADKLEQFNNGTYYLVDSSAVEYVDKDGNVMSVKDKLDGTSSTGTNVVRYTAVKEIPRLGSNSGVTVVQILNALWREYNYTQTVTFYEVLISNSFSAVKETPTKEGILHIIYKPSALQGVITSGLQIRYESTSNNSYVGSYVGEASYTASEGFTGVIWTLENTGAVIGSLEDLGLTEDATIENVFAELNYRETALINVTEFANYETLFPNECTEDQSALFKIVKQTASMATFEWIRRDGKAYAIGGLDDNNAFTGWNKIQTSSSGSSITYTSLTELGLTSDATFQDAVDALPKGGSALLGVTEFTNYQTIFPYEEGNDQFGRVHIVKGTSDGARVYARWFRKDGVKEAIAIFNINDNKFGGWRILKDHRTYTSLTELGLTTNATIQEVIDAVPIGSTAILRTDAFTNWSTLFNGIQYGYFKVEKTVNGLSNIELQDVITPNLRYFGAQSSGKFSKWIQTSSKVTAAFNSKTFKIDITKGNENWNGNMKFGYCIDESYGEIIISSLGKTEVMWDHSTGVRYVKSVTYTIDPDNKAHVTIGVELHDTVYGIHQLETAGDFATINSFTGDAFTGTSVAKRGATRGRNNGVGILCEVADLGLTLPCTTVQIAQAMRNLTNYMNRIPTSGMIGIFDNNGNKITDAPSQYGLLQINVYGYDRVMIRFDGIGSSSYTGSWIGQIKGSSGTFSSITWSRLDNYYSTTEQVVGTWTDGSTLYRTTFDYTLDAAYTDDTSLTIGSISGFNLVVKIDGLVRIANGAFVPIPFYQATDSGTANHGRVYVSVSSGSVVYKGSAMARGSKIIVTIEYTKS